MLRAEVFSTRLAGKVIEVRAQSVKHYRLHCTMNLNAAQIAYAAMAQNG